MKRKKLLVIAAVFAISLALAQTAFADIPNRFISTDGDSTFFDLSKVGGAGLNSGWSFGVYDNDLSKGLDLLNGSNSDAKFSVTQSGNDWVINVTDGAASGQTLDIGNSPDFSFYFTNGSDYDTDFSITDLGSNQYKLDSAKGGGVAGSDLAPVPLPSSAIFLFSGILGLVAFGSRRETMK